MSILTSIRGKILFLIVLIVVVLTGLDALLVPARAAEAEREGLRRRARAAAAMLADASRAAVEFEQIDAAEDTLSAGLADELVTWAAIYDQGGKRVAAVGDGDAPRMVSVQTGAPSLPENSTTIREMSPIRAQGRVLGWVAIALKKASIEKRFRDVRNAVLMQGSIVAILGFAFAFFLSDRIARSLRRITKAAERIARGDVSADLDLTMSKDELGVMARAFQHMNARLRELQENVSRVAAGDLTVTATGEGELFVGFRTMVESLRQLAARIAASSNAVATAAAGMFSAVREQEASATQQTAALEQIRRTLETLALSADQVASDASKVREISNQSLTSSQSMAEQTRLVSTHSDRIGEILSLIQDIANRSDLLALNAALEGTKAGEVGRGFSLVAGEMRRLSEHVMDSVRDIRKLIADMRAVAHASVMATEEGIKLARDTAASAAKISEAVVGQREGTTQVKTSADDIVRVVNDGLSSNAETTASAESLLQLSHELRQTVQAFRLAGGEHRSAISETVQ